MKNFDYKRFGRLFKWELLTNKKFYLNMALGMFLAFYFAQTLSLWSSDEGILDAAAGLCLFILGFYLMISGSWLFSTMKTKQQRTAFLMLPATNLEKFVVRWLSVTIGWLGIGLVAFLAADLVRAILSYPLQQHTHALVTPNLFKVIHLSLPQELVHWKAILLAVLAITWQHSVFMLGGAFFRRHQFIITSAIIFVLSNVLGVFSLYAFRMLFTLIDWDMYTINSDVLFGYAVVFFLAFILLNYFLSYKIFRRMQIINNKWINV